MSRAMRMAAGVVAVSALALAGCSQGSSGSRSDSNKNADQGQVQAATGQAPAPFDKGQVHIAIVQNSGQGDYFQQYLNGTKKQAEALKMKLDVYDAQGETTPSATSSRWRI